MKNKFFSFITTLVMLCSFVGIIPKMEVEAAISNNWSWPTSIHSIQSDWPNYSWGSYHGGNDFPVSLNSPVYSTCYGEVVDVKSLTTSYGKHIKIKATVNGSTIYMRYCHLNSFNVSVGDKVQSGQLIGYSGSTGNSSGPHLHYEVRNANDIRGSSSNPNLNPRNYLPGTSYSFYIPDRDPIDRPIDNSYAVPWSGQPKATSGLITVYNVYGEPYSTSVHNIAYNDNCTIHEVYGSGFCKVEYPVSGGTHTEYAKTSDFDIPRPIPPTPVNEKYRVSTSSGANLRVRSTYSTSGSIVTEVANGTEFTISQKVNNWGYCDSLGGWLCLDYCTQIPIVNPPSYSSLSITNGYYFFNTNETINFRANSDTATVYWIGIDRDGQRVVTEQMPNGDFSISFTESGNYSAYVTAANDAGSIDSERVAFKVFAPADLGDERKVLIENIATGLLLSVDSDETDNVYGSEKGDVKKQLWKLKKQSDGSYMINLGNSGKCLDVYKAGAENGTNLIVYSENKESNQRFYFYRLNDAYYIKPIFSDLFVDMDVNGSDHNVATWGYGENHPPQKFNLIDVDNTPPEISDVEITDVTPEGYTVKCKFTDESLVTGGTVWVRIKDREGNFLDTSLVDPVTDINNEVGICSYRVKKGDYENKNVIYETCFGISDEYGNTAELWYQHRFDNSISEYDHYRKTVPDVILPEYGDINKDEKINVSDIVSMQKYLVNKQEFTKEQFAIADINTDGTVNVFDVVILKRRILKG